jgi:AcrR family transcriptional regulator
MSDEQERDTAQIQMAHKRRGYHSPTRQRQAEETHQRMLTAAHTLLSQRGYAGTTLEAIAAKAEVSTKTVVAVFGSKVGILAEVLNPAGFGSPYQEMLGRLRAEADPARRVAVVAELTRHVYDTLSAELDLLRGVAGIAPELAEIAQTIERRRWHQQERLIEFLQERGVLRTSLSREAATDELWALTSFDLYRMLVLQRGWTPERYEHWLTQTLIGHLLDTA